MHGRDTGLAHAWPMGVVRLDANQAGKQQEQPNTGFIFIRLLLLLCEGAKGNKKPRATFHALKLRMVILPVGVGMCIKILAVDTTTGIEFYMRVEHGVKIIIHGYPLGIRNTIIIT